MVKNSQSGIELGSQVIENIDGQFEGGGLDYIIGYSSQVEQKVIMAKKPPVPSIESFDMRTKVDVNLQNLSLGRGDTVIFDCDGVIAGETLDESLFFAFDEAQLNGQSEGMCQQITEAMTAGMEHGKGLDFTISKRLEIGGKYYGKEVLDKYINEKLRGSMNPYVVAVIQALMAAGVNVLFRTGGLHYIMDAYLLDIGVTPEQIVANRVKFDEQGKVSLDMESTMLTQSSKADWYKKQNFTGKVVEIGDSLRDVGNGDVRIGYGEYSYKEAVYGQVENYVFQPEALYYYLNNAVERAAA